MQGLRETEAASFSRMRVSGEAKGGQESRYGRAISLPASGGRGLKADAMPSNAGIAAKALVRQTS